MSVLTRTLADLRAKRAATRQYVEAADYWRELAREERKRGRTGEHEDRRADALMAEAADAAR